MPPSSALIAALIARAAARSSGQNDEPLRGSQLEMENSMERILVLLLIFASGPAVDWTNDDYRHLNNPDCGYACVFAELVRDRNLDVTIEQKTHSAQTTAGGSGEEEGITITQLPSEPK
jgi:hypothetical protein